MLKYKYSEDIYMKKLTLLLLVPALLLTSCGKGQKINDEKATELATKISEKTKGEDDDTPQNFEVVISATGASQKDSKKVETNLKYKLSVNEADETKLQVKGKEGDVKYDFCVMSIKQEGYEDELTYLKLYNEAEDKYDETIFLNSNDDRVTQYSLQILVPALLLASYSDPLALIEDEEAKNGQSQEGEGENIITYDNTVKYYSRGDGNLTIEASKKYVSGTFKEGEEEQLETYYTFTYDNYYIKSMVMKGKSNYNNDMKITMDVTLKKSKINFELPKGWEEMIAPDKSIPV